MILYPVTDHEFAGVRFIRVERIFLGHRVSGNVPSLIKPMLSPTIVRIGEKWSALADDSRTFCVSDISIDGCQAFNRRPGFQL
jgi:hypothetical protein